MGQTDENASMEVVRDSRALFERLAPSAGDGVRLLEVGARTVWLERVREGEAALPVHGPPALAAGIEAFPLSEAFAWIEDGARSGLLHFVYRDQAKSVYLERGEVVFASSNQQVDRLGESLLRAGVIQLGQLREAQRAFDPGARFGKILVERGFLTPRELWNGVKYQVEEIVRSLFAYEAGRILFWQQEVEPDNVVRLSLPGRRLVAEGLQRRDELHKFLAVLEDPRVRLVVVEGASVELGSCERAIAGASVEPTPFQTLVEGLDLDRESAARSVQLLRLVGALKLLRLREDEERAVVDASDIQLSPEAEGLRSLVSQLVKLIAALAEPIARADGEDVEGGVQERLAGTLEDAASRFPALLNSIDLGPGATLDPEPLIDRALGLPGDPEAQVLAGLGELVAYLDFEIMNHPGIDDPEAVLAGSAELRAGLGI